ncbi:MAG: uroporphyrinogen decarboxylase family protein [Nitrososphaeria archaeon]
MNRHERFFTALELKEPDYVPVTDLGMDPPIVEAILNRELGLGLTKFGWNVSFASDKTSAWESAISYRRNLFEACMKLGFDGVPALSDYSIVTKKYTPNFIDRARFVDQWGRIMQTSERAKTTYFVGGVIGNEEDIDKIELPDASEPDIIEMMDEILKPIKKEDVVIMGQVHSGWHLAFQARGGIDKISLDFYRNPGFVKRLMNKYAETLHKLAEAMIKVGVEVLWVTDDYADNNGPLINPRLIREYDLPSLQKIVNIGKRYNVPVLKHSDGNLYVIVDDLIDTGIKGLHPIEPGAMDLADMKKRYGHKICLLGSVDMRYVLPFGNEQDVRKEVRRCIDSAGKGGGYILTSSNSLHSDVKPENVFIMVDEARKYGKYPLQVA